MKIGFFGTPEIASYYVQFLNARYDIAFIVTAPDKPKGRGKHLAPPPVKEKADEFSLPCYQPKTLKDGALAETLAQHQCDMFVVVAYGKLIPHSIFSIPRLGTINLHPSLLPRYRGAAPVEWALCNGEQLTGVTIQLINEELDAGDIVIQSPVAIAHDDTAGDVYKKILPVGADLIAQAIEGLQDGTIVPVRQNAMDATYCGKITQETAHINWSLPSQAIHNMVRAFNPKPIAWTSFRGKTVKIVKTQLTDSIDVNMNDEPGLVITKSKKLFAKTGNGLIELLVLQPETKKPMDALSFMNGYRLHPDDRLV